MSAVQGAGRPTRGYRLQDGTRVPSVTTITGRFKDAGGLIHWAWQQGIDGINYRESRDKAAEAGSICHGYIEEHIHGRVPVVDFGGVYDQARQGYEAFLDWAESVELEVLETEQALVSEQYRFGGTFDALALVAGKPKLLDWKSSNAVYVEYVAQVAAYRQLLRERANEKVQRLTGFVDMTSGDAPDSALLLRIGKEHADFHLHSYPSSVLDIGWSYFLHAREMFDLDKELKKVAA